MIYSRNKAFSRSKLNHRHCIGSLILFRVSLYHYNMRTFHKTELYTNKNANWLKYTRHIRVVSYMLMFFIASPSHSQRICEAEPRNVSWFPRRMIDALFSCSLS